MAQESISIKGLRRSATAIGERVMSMLSDHPYLATATAAAGGLAVYISYKMNTFRKPYAHIPGPKPDGLKGNVDHIDLDDLAGSIADGHRKHGDCFVLWT